MTSGRYAYDQRCNGLEHLSGESDDTETSENFSISLVTFDSVPGACGAGKVSLHNPAPCSKTNPRIPQKRRPNAVAIAKPGQFGAYVRAAASRQKLLECDNARRKS